MAGILFHQMVQDFPRSPFMLWFGTLGIKRDSQDKLIIRSKTQDHSRQIGPCWGQIDGKGAPRKGKTSLKDM